MESERIVNDAMKVYQYEIDVGHSKSGSNHVIIIKSLKVRSDDLANAIQEVQAALRAFNKMTCGCDRQEDCDC